MRDDAQPQVELQDPTVLASHYTWKKQLLEASSVAVFAALFVAMLWRGWQLIDLRANAGLCVVAFLASMVVADFISGLVHWLADTWGTVEVPILGPTLVKNFREHHSAPKALTKKGLIETNGDNCMILVPAQVLMLLIPLQGAATGWVFFYAFCVAFTFWIMVTNQVHKWAHMEREELSAPVRLLQRLRVILPPSEHQIHHTIPFESHYAITNGWLNGPLRAIGFYRGLEWLGWRLFGAIPRENDIGTKAAVALAIRQGILPAGFEAGREIAGTRSTPTAPEAARAD